jgi:hypothetical protein
MNNVPIKSTFILSSSNLPIVVDRHFLVKIVHVILTRVTQYPASFRQINIREAQVNYTNRPSESGTRS